MDRGKIVAVITGIFSILLAVIYLVIVQILDFRGEMKPAPMSQLEAPVVATFDGQSGWGDRGTITNSQFAIRNFSLVLRTNFVNGRRLRERNY